MNILETIRQKLREWCILCGAKRRAANLQRVHEALAASNKMVAACSRLLQLTQQAIGKVPPCTNTIPRPKIHSDAAFLQPHQNVSERRFIV